MVEILSPTHSFVQWDTSDAIESCNFPDIELCLPVYADNDVNFQFVLETDTEEEADDLCDLLNTKIAVGIVDTTSIYGCADGFLLEFTAQKPQRFRISARQVLYNWVHGVPGFATVVSRGECFRIKILVDDTYSFCSNCFQRIADPCHTSVIEYGNDDNFAGFNYCNSGGEDSGDGGGAGECEPTFITFTNIPYLTIPYTAALQNVYGAFPTIDVWTYDENNNLVAMFQRTTLDNYPPTQIHTDFGGPSSGIIRIS